MNKKQSNGQQLRRIVIFANGQYRSDDFYRHLIKEDDYLICADGGADAAVRMGLVPDELIGDLDSVGQQVLSDLKKRGTVISRHRPDKDQSDLELAIDRAIEQRPAEIAILGALGKRTDHCLANLLLLHKTADAGLFAYLCDEMYQMYMITDSLEIHAEPGMIITLLPVSDVAEKVSTRGLQYPLHAEDLTAGSSRGLSNIVAESRVSISIQKGRLLVIAVKNE